MFSGDGGGGDMPAAPPQWQAPNMDSTAAAVTNAIPGMQGYNSFGEWLPWAQQSAAQLYNNPYRGQFQDLTNAAAGVGWNTGMGQVDAGNALMGAGAGVLPYSQQILEMGFDPQNAYRDRAAQRLTDSTRAGLNARGIVMSPYGAGVENAALSNFGIDWENNLLNRANTASQGAGYLLNSGGNAINLGQNVGTLGVNQLMQAGAAPYQTFNTIGNDQFKAIGQVGQTGQSAAAIPQSMIDSWMKYLGVGNQAQSNANQAYGTQVTAQNNQFNQNQRLGQNFGASLQGLTPRSGQGYGDVFSGLSRMFG